MNYLLFLFMLMILIEKTYELLVIPVPVDGFDEKPYELLVIPVPGDVFGRLLIKY